jgi:hypothetical protein
MQKQRIKGSAAEMHENGPYLLVRTAFPHPYDGPTTWDAKTAASNQQPAAPPVSSPRLSCPSYARQGSIQQRLPYRPLRSASTTGRRITNVLRTTVPSHTMASAYEAKSITRCSLPRYVYPSKNMYMRKPQ